MEEHEDVVETGSELVAQHLEFVDGAVPHHGEDVFFEQP